MNTRISNRRRKVTPRKGPSSPSVKAATTTKKRKKKKVSTSTATTPSFKNDKPSKSKLPTQLLHDANLLGTDGVAFIVDDWSGEVFVGARVAKPFGGKTKKWFYGLVDKFRFDKRRKKKLWHVTYEDGAQEEMTEDEFTYWLQQYNTLWEDEMKSSEEPYQKISSVSSEKENKSTKKKEVYYKVSWKLSRTIEELADKTFDNNDGYYGSDEEDDREDDEFTTGKKQKKELYTSVEEANAVAADQFKMLAYQYIDEEDRANVKVASSTPDKCKRWNWSYRLEDVHENIFRCEGFVQVERLSK